jgi:hypothetical protein
MEVTKDGTCSHITVLMLYALIRELVKKEYYRILGGQAIRFRGPAFWRYHKKALKTLGETFDRFYPALGITFELLWMAANQGRTALSALHYLKHKFASIQLASI